jgi:NifU-like protein involved in Fe-S cluster formation
VEKIAVEKKQAVPTKWAKLLTIAVAEEDRKPSATNKNYTIEGATTDEAKAVVTAVSDANQAVEAEKKQAVPTKWAKLLTIAVAEEDKKPSATNKNYTIEGATTDEAKAVVTAVSDANQAVEAEKKQAVPTKWAKLLALAVTEEDRKPSAAKNYAIKGATRDEAMAVVTAVSDANQAGSQVAASATPTLSTMTLMISNFKVA